DGNRLQCGHQSRLSHRQRLHDLSRRKLPRRPAARQHGEVATRAATNRETLTSRKSRTDGGGFEPPVPFGTHAFQACTINRSVTHPLNSCSCSSRGLKLQTPE